MDVSLTGIQPSGAPHLGNYLGMIRPALALAARTDSLCFVADFHALTTVRDAESLRRRRRDVAATWLALGLDPARTALYCQSDVPEVCELAWILACVTPKGLLNRAHAYKAAVAENVAAGRDDDAGVNMGLFEYPLLMAADILVERADLVPVGLDQQQHVEITRDIAGIFNSQYGDVLVVPTAFVDEGSMTIPGTDGRKMSKSYGNVVPILAPPDELRRRVAAIVTDSRAPNERGDPEQCNVFAMFRHVGTADEVEEVAARYREGGIGYREVKDRLYETLEHTFRDARARYDELIGDESHLDAVLADGAERARARARPTMASVREAVGLPSRICSPLPDSLSENSR
jgi:tryptophanyl-tRNA synthetase